ncbi:hypothetical protein R3P38DRAFT_3371930 [Favolaschia claudopus]|uniref:Uncharacterized protein n=1 Tax=Favolaschia claudopus TaxID=2862362 RepID=A0AAV9ZVW6_9AGAR
MYFCVLSALSPYGGGPTSLTYDESDDIAELALQLAEEVAPTLEGKLSFATFKSFYKTHYDWRNTYDWQEDDFCYTGLVIGPQGSSPKIQVRRVERYSYDYRKWRFSLYNVMMGRYEFQEPTRYGGKSASFFCWERPYLYFKTWLRFSSPSISDLDDTAFAKNSSCSLIPITITAYIAARSLISYRAYRTDVIKILKKTARKSSSAPCALVQRRCRHNRCWKTRMRPLACFAADFGVWMVTRPDVWPPPPARLDSTAVSAPVTL